jgi:hypothetical protein
MNYLLGSVLAIVGLAILIWNKALSARWLAFNARQVGHFGRLASSLGWDDQNRPFTRFLYRLLTIMLGLFLLMMALHSFFGTFYVGSAAQPTNTILEVQK